MGSSWANRHLCSIFHEIWSVVFPNRSTDRNTRKTNRTGLLINKIIICLVEVNTQQDPRTLRECFEIPNIGLALISNAFQQLHFDVTFPLLSSLAAVYLRELQQHQVTLNEFCDFLNQSISHVYFQLPSLFTEFVERARICDSSDRQAHGQSQWENIRKTDLSQKWPPYNHKCHERSNFDHVLTLPELGTSQCPISVLRLSSKWPQHWHFHDFSWIFCIFWSSEEPTTPLNKCIVSLHWQLKLGRQWSFTEQSNIYINKWWDFVNILVIEKHDVWRHFFSFFNWNTSAGLFSASSVLPRHSACCPLVYWLSSLVGQRAKLCM